MTDTTTSSVGSYHRWCMLLCCNVCNESSEDAFIEPSEEHPFIGKYHLLKTLGKGGYAEVKLAKHNKTGREVAIKIIKKQQMDSVHIQKLFQEVKIMKRLDHPHIIKLYKVIDTRTTLYLVLEYASGGDLFHYLVEHGRIKEDKARVLFHQLLEATNHCHQKCIVHRDIKPENILFDSEGNIKLSDFGLSDTFTQGKMMNKFPGTATHIPPEFYQHKEYIGPEVDIWALGVVLYQMVTCSLPFYSPKLATLRELILQGHYEVPSYVSIECKTLLSKLLVKDPNLRRLIEPIKKDRWISVGPQVDPETTDGPSTTNIEKDDEIRSNVLTSPSIQDPKRTESNSTENSEKPICRKKRARSISSLGGELDDYVIWSSELPPLKRLKLDNSDEHDSDNDIFVTAKSRPSSPDSEAPCAEEHQEASMSSTPLEDRAENHTAGENGRSRWRRLWQRVMGLFCCCTK
ncbi:serine/threonine-protein kinase MARK2-like [Bombina bombina]|uniref:serine/threonine-protein kinase MARK2-like n=1 Tax=Bombina bombina TaxID=8345 RepID=UPI00235AA3CB|nr:serine/threonine-protein kinase MARK2-like [Bombina bombina]